VKRLQTWWRTHQTKQVEDDGWGGKETVLSPDLDDFNTYFDDENDGLSYCCAFKVIGEFGNGIGLAEPHPGWTYPQHLCAFALQIATDIRGPILATTIPKQTGAIKLLRDLGFEELAVVKNPNTKNLVTLWLYE
jgi:hypothetical protein